MIKRFILALSTTPIAKRDNGSMIQLSVGMCPECGALVAEDQESLHERFHELVDKAIFQA